MEHMDTQQNNLAESGPNNRMHMDIKKRHSCVALLFTASDAGR